MGIIIALLCCFALSFNGLAANQLGLNSLKQSKSNSSEAFQEDPIMLMQDHVMNFSTMNFSIEISPTFGSSQAVKFTAPKPGWNLENILVMATDGWNASGNELPSFLPFALEIRDADLKLLYHYADIQFPYFTSNEGVRMAVIEVPSIPVTGDFFVCFYGYRSLGLVAEIENATGNSYYFDKLDAMLYPAELQTRNNQTLPVNWLIRVAGR